MSKIDDTFTTRVKRFLCEKELATRWGVSVKFVQKQRYAGGGVPFAKLGNAAVRYALDAIEKYEADATRFSTSDPGPHDPDEDDAAPNKRS